MGGQQGHIQGNAVSQPELGNRMAARAGAFAIGCAILAVWFFVSVANPNPPKRGLFAWWLSRVAPRTTTPLYVDDSGGWYVAAYRQDSSVVVSAWKDPTETERVPPYRFFLKGFVDGHEAGAIDSAGEMSFDPVHVDWLSGGSMFGQTFVAPILPGFSGDLEVGISVARPQTQDEDAIPHVRLREEPEKTFMVAYR